MDGVNEILPVMLQIGVCIWVVMLLRNLAMRRIFVESSISTPIIKPLTINILKIKSFTPRPHYLITVETNILDSETMKWATQHNQTHRYLISFSMASLPSKAFSLFRIPSPFFMFFLRISLLSFFFLLFFFVSVDLSEMRRKFLSIWSGTIVVS